MLHIRVDNLVCEHLQPENIGYKYPLLLIHGAGGTSRYWRNYLQYFCDQGWIVYAINLRGHHPSDRDENLAQVMFEDYLADVDHVIRRLDIGNAALIGHSLGGLIAQKTAEKNPGIQALVTIASAPPYGIAMEMHNDLPYSGTIIRAMWGLINMKPVKPTFMMAEKTVLNNIEPEHRQEIFNLFVAESLVVGYQVAQGIPVYPGRIRCPKLVCGCAQDRLAPVAMQHQLAAFLGADEIQYDRFGHLPMLERGWEKSAVDIAKWLRDHITG